jgi:signal transduction histidine kinase
MVWQAGFGVALMTGLDGGASSGYYAGINLVMLGAAVLLPWDAMLSLAAAVALIVSYVGVCVAWGGVPTSRVRPESLLPRSTALIMVVSHRAHARRSSTSSPALALEEAGRHRDAFLANVTHELRTPLAAILGFAEMLVDYLDDATVEQRGWLARIQENALTLYRLIVQILDFSKIEAGALELAREPMNLASIVAKVADDMRAIAGDAGTLVETAVPATRPSCSATPARRGDRLEPRRQRAQVLRRPPDHLTLRRRRCTRRRGSASSPIPARRARREYAEIDVTDTGVGIRPRTSAGSSSPSSSSTARRRAATRAPASGSRSAPPRRRHGRAHRGPQHAGQGSTFALLLPIEATPARVAPSTTDRAATSAERRRGVQRACAVVVTGAPAS